MSAATQLLEAVKNAMPKTGGIFTGAISVPPDATGQETPQIQEVVPVDLTDVDLVTDLTDTDAVAVVTGGGLLKFTMSKLLSYLTGKANTWTQKQTFELGISSRHQFTQILTPVAANNEINCAVSNSFSKTITGATTFTFLAPGTPVGTCYAFLLDIDHVSGSIFWPANVYWSATPPELTSGRIHQFVFYTSNNGVSWRASVLPNYTA